MPPSGSGSPTHTAPAPHCESWMQALVQNGMAVASCSTVQAYALPSPRFTHSPPLTVQYFPTLRSLPSSPGWMHGVLPPEEDTTAVDDAVPEPEEPPPLLTAVVLVAAPLPALCAWLDAWSWEDAALDDAPAPDEEELEDPVEPPPVEHASNTNGETTLRQRRRRMWTVRPRARVPVIHPAAESP